MAKDSEPRGSEGKKDVFDPKDYPARKQEVTVYETGVALDPNAVYSGEPDGENSPSGKIDLAAAGALAQDRQNERENAQIKHAEEKTGAVDEDSGAPAGTVGPELKPEEKKPASNTEKANQATDQKRDK
jgi:hypothetical protein